MISLYGQPYVFAYLPPRRLEVFRIWGQVLLNLALPAFSTAPGTQQALKECWMSDKNEQIPTKNICHDGGFSRALFTH